MEEESSATGAPSELRAEPNDTTDPNERTFWFTKREKLRLALGCFFLVGLPLGLGLGLGFGLALNKDDGSKSKSPTSAPFTLQDELRVKLAEFFMDGDSVFDDPISPQNLAIEWLAGDTVWQIENSTLRMERRYVLAVLYYSTQGDTWQEKYDFLTDSDECTWNKRDGEQDRINWKGVICNEEDEVAEIVLAENNLIGSIPEELVALDHLEALVLSNNRLSGRLPIILKGLSALKRTDWQTNDMEGSIPSYDHMPALTSLNIAENKLSGSLPGTLKLLTNLEKLELYQNSIDGTIPAGLLFLTNLAVLTLSNNQLSGSIPKETLQMKALRDVDLSDNLLSGSLPSVLGENLEIFLAFYNSLTGTFPWTTPSPLKYVVFSENRLTGTLPWADIAKFPLLTGVVMSGNELKGGLDDAMGQLTTLIRMDLQWNQLTGTIPTAIGNLTDILSLQLSSNQLSGTLPSELGNLRNLEQLILNDNYSLNGTIPTELAELSKLVRATFHTNRFTGSLDFLCPLNPMLSADCYDDPPMVECSCCQCL